MTENRMLSHLHFDTLSGFIDEYEERMKEKLLIHHASELLEKAIRNEAELEEALQKAISTLHAARHPATRHFKLIYISKEGVIKKDWLVSDLGLRLIIMNADRSNPVMAALQIEILSSK